MPDPILLISLFALSKNPEHYNLEELASPVNAYLFDYVIRWKLSNLMKTTLKEYPDTDR
jgi:hypothetical protein